MLIGNEDVSIEKGWHRIARMEPSMQYLSFRVIFHIQDLKLVLLHLGSLIQKSLLYAFIMILIVSSVIF